MSEAGLAAPGAADDARMRLASAARAAEFTAVYNEAFRDVSGYCAHLLGDEHLARDVAQEAFTRLFARWRAVDDPRSYAFVIATNLVRDEWRRRGRNATLVAGLRGLVRHEAPSGAPDLHDVVARLPRRLRDVVVLHVVADLPVADVARILSIPAGTVKRRMHEARARLRADWLETS